MTGTFPYYSDGKAGEKYGTGDYKATNGRLYKVTNDGTAGTPLAWYPAPGFRDGGIYGRLGALTHVGYGGYSWASTVSSTDGMHLYFHVTWLYPGFANGRGYGFQLRCLSHPQGVLLVASAPNRGKDPSFRVPSGTAPGFRNSNSGVLGGVGNGGFSYSSSVSGIGGLNSNSYSQYLNTGNSDYRASGLQLRCLSE
ncbi:hypothetical protein [uncultured Rikenella sp.]|uniref:hypothetical protein n=1 Tax=uncultured Rikenella sp. TaxID=368003 RepID=UPI0026284690|nr:hypothetical protein [uncultured Rikenella sp.]